MIFHILNENDFERDCHLAYVLKEIGLSICKSKDIKVNKVTYEKVTMENEFWININFEIDCDNPHTIAEINLELSQKLASNNQFLHSEIAFIPTFLKGFDSHASEAIGISCVR